MKVSLCTLVKDEMDVLPWWLDYNAAIFDYIFLVDNGSTDGSLEFMQGFSERSKGVRLFNYHDPRYERDKVLETLRKVVVEETDAEWLFFLDVDEFLEHSSSEKLGACLNSFEDDLLLFKWRNCYLRSNQHGSVRAYKQRRASKLGKVAVRRSLMKDGSYLIPRGVHALVHESGKKRIGTPAGELYHFPVRSLEQAWVKVLNGTRNRLQILQSNPASPESWHYPAILRVMLEQPNWDIIPLLVFDYGDRQGAKDYPLPDISLESEFEELSAAFLPESPQLSRIIPAASVAELPAREVAKNSELGQLVEEILTMGGRDSFPRLDAELQLSADGEIKHQNDFSGIRFPTLSGLEHKPISEEDLAIALQAAFSEIAFPVQSSWGEHIPLLFSLFSLMKPRVYVELGVHNGGSFLSACQAVRDLRLESTCIGVDSWKGDAQAGFYSEGVFEKFRESIRENFSEFSGYIRAEFDVAAEQFEAGSVDLLHIDGFHSFAAVKSDFEAWRDKMSERGVVIFHDINEFRPGFGVWKFWRDLRKNYPYLEFGHGHGLGILAIGPSAPLHAALDAFGANVFSPSSQDILQVLFGGIGQLSWRYSRQAAGLRASAARAPTAGSDARGSKGVDGAPRQSSDHGQTLSSVRETGDVQRRVVRPLSDRRREGFRLKPYADAELVSCVAEISKSGLFNKNWYLARYADVAKADADPITHYVQWGAAEGRDPSPHFHTAEYIAKHPEVEVSGINPLLHHVQSCRKRGE